MNTKLIVGLAVVAGGIFFLARRAKAEASTGIPPGSQVTTFNPASPGGGSVPVTTTSSDATKAEQQSGALKSISSPSTVTDLVAQARGSISSGASYVARQVGLQVESPGRAALLRGSAAGARVASRSGKSRTSKS